MRFPGHFRERILPQALHLLNVCFMVPELRRECGGCAGNIAWNLELLLPGSARPMATVGTDFFPLYSKRIEKHGLCSDWITQVADHCTAQAFIITDADNNQITAFHPGAMNEAHSQHVQDAIQDNPPVLAIISPDGRAGMLQHARECHELGLPFIFDPGQGLPMFTREELRAVIDQANWVAVNDYEWQLLQKHTGYREEDCVERLAALIITCGARGSRIHTREGCREIPAIPCCNVVDPTGCGDAYRAGILYGLMQNLDWETTGRIASLLGTIKLGTAGTQNHHFTREEFWQRFSSVWHDLPPNTLNKAKAQAMTGKDTYETDGERLAGSTQACAD